MKRLLFAAIVLLTACTGPAGEPEKNRGDYFFDLKAFFAAEAGRLTATGKPAIKEVTRNRAVERRRLKINWDTELALFRESDINRPAWKDSYRTTVTGDTTTYSATDEDLRTRRITLVRQAGGGIRHIRIENRVSNFLYTTTETLDYFPASGYAIDRSQSVRIIGTNHYTIKTKLE